MNDLSFRSILTSAVLAGLVAGLLVSAFHFVVTEPVIDRAIALEEQLSQQAGEASEPPPVSRDVQRGGLVVGFLMYGLTWSVLFGVVFYLVQRLLPAPDASWRGILLAVAGYWSVCLLPFLKYPANPPGVGDPETITYRQGLYIGLLAAAVVTTALAIAVARYLERYTRSIGTRAGAALAVAVAGGALAYIVMPANPDPIRMPTEVVNGFRALSVAGLTLFWVILGGGFAFLAARTSRPPARAS